MHQRSIQMQNEIGADVIMALDDVISSQTTGERVEEVMAQHFPPTLPPPAQSPFVCPRPCARVFVSRVTLTRRNPGHASHTALDRPLHIRSQKTTRSEPLWHSECLNVLRNNTGFTC